jgi:hypothetical protein
VSNSFETEPAANNTEDSTGAFVNPAVARCCNAGTRAYRTAMAKSQNAYEASKAAHQAFRNALPPLSGADNIRDFIACVAQGMLIESIREDTGARLLYAAQVASNAFRNTSSKKKAAA